ncbi:FAD/NAD(P)-binding domain-containing protein [Trametes coccinea BRFM310]|uniref:FAD/NAD(P)-binding domain-containing protein n=1 Tax=Trametes coccinea (strain BRFM310) TaxID=1353009 RepID=A0A1Y2IKN6_TRAC3|nr:FAD/NAD(P)-binding domain-containing protein [Trametes coccinea BRFM310]
MDFDVVVLGTGLAESIAAAALSKAGFKVAHVDHNPYYGGDEASLTLDELAQWADTRTAASADNASAAPGAYISQQKARYTSVSRSGEVPPQSRQYAIPLAPSIVPAIGPHINSLVASGVSRYGSFKLLEKIAIYDRPGYVQSVPGSKEDVFKSKVLSLVEKRRLMRFLMFAASEFEGKKELEGKEELPFRQYLQQAFALTDKPATAITYALAFCVSPDEPTLPALQRIRQYLRSAGRYGASPFLVGHYGGLGETAQGFCRTSAVKGGTYILGRQVLSVKPPATTDSTPVDEKAGPSSDTPARCRVDLEELEEPLTAKILLSSPDYLPTTAASSAPSSSSSSSSIYPVARCIAIIDRPLVFTPTDAPEEAEPANVEEGVETGEDEPGPKSTPTHEVDTAVLVFPPGSLADGSSTAAAHVLVTGEGSVSAPRGRWILNISLPLLSSELATSSAEALLLPYLYSALTLTVPPSAPAEMQPAEPLFTVFYIHHPVSEQASSSFDDSSIIVTPPCTSLLPAIADEATQNAEGMFWRAVELLTGKRKPEERDEKEEKGSEEDSEAVDSFWPPLDAAEAEISDDW